MLAAGPLSPVYYQVGPPSIKSDGSHLVDALLDWHERGGGQGKASNLCFINHSWTCFLCGRGACFSVKWLMVCKCSGGWYVSASPPHGWQDLRWASGCPQHYIASTSIHHRKPPFDLCPPGKWHTHPVIHMIYQWRPPSSFAQWSSFDAHMSLAGSCSSGQGSAWAPCQVYVLKNTSYHWWYTCLWWGKDG